MFLMKAGALLFIIVSPVPLHPAVRTAWRTLDDPGATVAPTRVYLRVLNGSALLVGCGIGTAVGTWMAWTLEFQGGDLYRFDLRVERARLIALYALAANATVSLALSAL
jgi:hypothetical protein